MAPRDPHRGGCWFCLWISDGTPRRCTHPAYPIPLPFLAARDDATRCGATGAYWAPRLELTSEEPVA